MTFQPGDKIPPTPPPFTPGKIGLPEPPIQIIKGKRTVGDWIGDIAGYIVIISISLVIATICFGVVALVARWVWSWFW